MKFKIVIPARYASTRLPGKPLLDLAGKPMIRHVWERARASGADEIIIATDDERIVTACQAFGARAHMTDAGHASGTDRIAQLAGELGWSDATIVVNLQGDEPLMPPANLHQVAELLQLNPEAGVATLCTPIADDREFFDNGVVKVVHDARGRALYFSRAPIPLVRESHAARPESALRHLGLYAYRVAALREIASAPPCALEKLEHLEQLRALWLGITIQVDVATARPGHGVDNAADAAVVAAILQDKGRAPDF